MSTQTKDKKETNVYTVENLRRKGFKVDITHLRRVKGQHGSLLQKWEIADRNDINPKGGATEAVIVTPDKIEVKAVANCYWKDAYCKRTGTSVALRVALENLKEE